MLVAAISVHHPNLLIDQDVVGVVVGVDIDDLLIVRRPRRIVVVATRGEAVAAGEGNKILTGRCVDDIDLVVRVVALDSTERDFRVRRGRRREKSAVPPRWVNWSGAVPSALIVQISKLPLPSPQYAI